MSRNPCNLCGELKPYEFGFSTTSQVDALGEYPGPVRAMSVHYDAFRDTLTINGIRYTGTLFRGLAGLRPNRDAFRIVARSDGVITLVTAGAGVEPEI